MEDNGIQPYRLIDVLSSEKGVVLVEAEQNCEKLKRLDITATSMRNWRVSWCEYFKGKAVYIIPDNDYVSNDRSLDIADQLVGHADSVKIVYLNVNENEDIADWIKAGNGKAQLSTLIGRANPYVKREPKKIPENVVHISAATNQDELTGWEMPVDIFTKLKPPVLDTTLLPPVIGDYIKDQAELIGVDPGVIGLSILVTCASAIDDRIRIQPKVYEEGWTESARIWGAIVGDPSVKKTPAIKRAVGQLKKIDIDLHEENGKKLAEYRRDEKIYKKLEDNFVKNQIDAIESEKEFNGKLPESLEHPEIPRAIIEDTTIEKLALILQHSPRGALLLRDELSGWFGSMDAYNGGGKAGGKDRPLWLEAYNGGSRSIDRVGSGSMVVPNWSVCMLGGIQPAMIRDISQKLTDDGLLQRFMVVIAQPVPKGVDRPVNNDAKNKYSTLIKNLFAIEYPEKAIKLSKEAIQVREKMEDRIHLLRTAQIASGSLLSHLAKWEGLFPRLLLIFHCIESSAASKYPAKEVAGSTAELCYKFMFEYLLHHSVSFHSEMLEEPKQQKHAKWVAGHILSRGLAVITRREIQGNYKAMRTAKPWEYGEMMSTLEALSWIKPCPTMPKSGDNKINRWLVNPQVHRLFQETAKQEAEQRAEKQEAIRKLKTYEMDNNDNIQ